MTTNVGINASEMIGMNNTQTIGMNGKLCNQFVHYSANYNGLSSVGLKGGEHSLIASIAYVNQPVAMTKDENGNIIFKRGSYAPN